MRIVKLFGGKQQSRNGTVYNMVYTDANGVIIDDQRVTNYLEFDEMTPPSAPSTNGVRIFARDNGSGKTQICALFPTGAVVPLGTEP